MDFEKEKHSVKRSEKRMRKDFVKETLTGFQMGSHWHSGFEKDWLKVKQMDLR